ncbi:MAG: helix-turn-helix transcriptional regulator [Clostridia bacterium]|nr:helix-turn-helix transcriptional regulator [Clostridia bacterium]
MKATYIKTHLRTLINVTKIVTIHYYEFDKSFTFGGESHDFWEMVYVDKGKVLVKSEREELVLGQGDIIFHKPNEFHAIRAYDSEPNFFVISFVSHSPAMTYFKKYHTRLDHKLRPFISAIIQEAEATFTIPKNEPTLTQLVKKEGAILGGEQFIKTYLEQLLILLIRDIQNVSRLKVFPSKESMEHHLISSIQSYLEEHIEGELKIAEVCAYVGYSKSYLYKLFREQTGTTIAAYRTVLRVGRAKQLIRENRLNFSQISDLLSFDNPQYFSRVFKRITGMSPSEFKQTLSLE